MAQTGITATDHDSTGPGVSMTRGPLFHRRVAVVACFAAGLASGVAVRAIRAERAALVAAERSHLGSVVAGLSQAAALERIDDDAGTLRTLVWAASALRASPGSPAVTERLVHDLAFATSAADVREAGAAHLGKVLAIATMPVTGVVATASADRTVRLWRPDGRPLGQLTGFGGAVTSLRFAAASARLVTADDRGQVAVWEIPSGKPVTVFDAPRLSQLGEVALMPQGDGAVVAAGRGVWLRPLGGERSTLMYQGNGRAVTLDVDPRGRRVASGHEDGTVLVWHAENLEVRVLGTATASAPESAPLSVRFWPGAADRLVALTENGGLRVWDLGGDEWPSESWELDARGLGSLAFASDGSAAAAVGDGEVLRLPLAGMASVRRQLRGARTTAIAFTTGGALFVGGSDGSVRLAPMMPPLGEQLGSRPEAVVVVQSLSGVSDLLALDARGGLARFPGRVAWTAPDADGELEFPLRGTAAAAGIVAASGGQVWRWSPGDGAETPARVEALCTADDVVVSLAIGPVGTLYGDASGAIGTCAGEATRVLAQLSAVQISALAVGASVVAAGTDTGAVHVFDTAGTKLWAAAGEPATRAPIARLALLDGGGVIAAGRDGRLVRYDARGDSVSRWRFTNCEVRALFVSEGSGRLAAGCADGTLRVARLAEAESEALKLQLHRGAITWISLDADGQTAITAGEDGRVLRTPLHQDDLDVWVSRACAWLRADPNLGEVAIPGCSAPRP
jgi:WD40 repeat protein